MNIPLDTVGVIEQGAEAGTYVLLRYDPERTGGYYVLRADDPGFTGAVFDDWVEDRVQLERYVRECGWGVRWLDAPPPGRW